MTRGQIVHIPDVLRSASNQGWGLCGQEFGLHDTIRHVMGIALQVDCLPCMESIDPRIRYLESHDVTVQMGDGVWDSPTIVLHLREYREWYGRNDERMKALAQAEVNLRERAKMPRKTITEILKELRDD